MLIIQLKPESVTYCANILGVLEDRFVIDINDDGKFTVTLMINGKEKQEKNITEIISFERWIINEDVCTGG
ncbi:unnamed protein product [Rhizophagus irregularis]|nr:unnamed protein product [Rhizophagus irregularis]CAB4439639.1 unnamed protein product [Rhizophagus irregularis]